MNDPVITALSARAYTVPTDAPEADGTLAWDATTIVVVEARTADPSAPTGLGWTYAPAACVRLVDDLLAPVALGTDALDVPRTWESMVRAVRNAGRSGTAMMAVSAVDTALWDLKARLLGLPLHRLIGAVHDSVPVYGSGGFTTYSDAQLRGQLNEWLGLEIPRVKIKIGESWGSRTDRDVERTQVARETVGDDVELYVDANGAYRPKQAVRVGGRLDDLGVSWFEEPVSSEDLVGLRFVRGRVGADVTAGEYGHDLAYFEQMAAAGACDCLQVDVTRCGGYTPWSRICAVAAAHGLEVSGHCAPNLHAPVASATPNLRHLEWFHDHARIEAMLFEPLADLAAGAIRLADHPGHGLSLREVDAAPYLTMSSQSEGAA